MKLRAAGLLVAAGLALVVPNRLAAPPAAAEAPTRAATNYAALVVDTGSEVRTACVPFSEASITGRQLLERAGTMDPVFASIGGQGSAVCALCGVGCPATDCLTSAAPNYWSYHRAPAGSSGYTYSSVGAGATTVRNGDVEGWRWGTGAKPPYKSFASVCPMAVAPTTQPPPTQPPPTQPPTTASPPTTTSPTSPTSPGPTATRTPGGATTTGDTAATDSSTSTAAAAAMSTTTTRTGPDQPTAGAEEVAGSPVADRSADGGDGWLGSALGFAVALGAVLGLGLRLRRTRRPTS